MNMGKDSLEALEVYLERAKLKKKVN